MVIVLDPEDMYVYGVFPLFFDRLCVATEASVRMDLL